MRRRFLGPLAIALAAAAALEACGGGRGSEGAATRDGVGPAGAALADAAREFRRDGVLLGAEALADRFGRDGVSIAGAVVQPDDLPLFLAASLPVVACTAELPAIVYVSPLFRSLLVTRWSRRNGIRLESVHAIPAADGAAARWVDALPGSSSATELLAARHADALRRARDDALCARTREPATRPEPLIADDERDADLDRLADPADRLGELQRALAALLMHGEAKPLETLGFDVRRDELARLPAAEPAVFPVPVSARADGPVSLVLYADLSIAGRYLLFGHVGADADGGRADSAGGVELIALPL